jgi:SnoaL-like domain
MSLEDKVAIQEVIAQYSYAYDAQDAEGFAALFTEDALWELFAAGATHPAIRLESRAAIHAWAVQHLHDRRGRFISRHYQSSGMTQSKDAGSMSRRLCWQWRCDSSERMIFGTGSWYRPVNAGCQGSVGIGFGAL